MTLPEGTFSDPISARCSKKNTPRGIWLQWCLAQSGGDTLVCMDSVRFGRALGVGAREVAKALVKAADAATSPNPSQPTRPPQAEARRPVAPVIQKAAHTAAQVRRTSGGVAEGSRRFGKAVWTPAARLTGVLWLEVTGVFFALFAVAGVSYCWKNWRVLHGGSLTDQERFWVMAAMGAVFGYFCVSNFARARRRSRQ